MERTEPCNSCGVKTNLRCVDCKKAFYCNDECQRRDWLQHATVCSKTNVGEALLYDQMIAKQRGQEIQRRAMRTEPCPWLRDDQADMETMERTDDILMSMADAELEDDLQCAVDNAPGLEMPPGTIPLFGRYVIRPVESRLSDYGFPASTIFAYFRTDVVYLFYGTKEGGGYVGDRGNQMRVFTLRWCTNNRVPIEQTTEPTNLPLWFYLRLLRGPARQFVSIPERLIRVRRERALTNAEMRNPPDEQTQASGRVAMSAHVIMPPIAGHLDTQMNRGTLTIYFVKRANVKDESAVVTVLSSIAGTVYIIGGRVRDDSSYFGQRSAQYGEDYSQVYVDAVRDYHKRKHHLEYFQAV